MRGRHALVVLAAVLLGAAGPIQGVWTGQYVCAQGLTPLELFVSQPDGEAPLAYFHFGAGTAELPEGCFTMRGTLEGGHLAFTAAAWRKQPAYYITVDLDGTVAGAEYTGKVAGLGCSTFSLHREDALRPVPAACEPTPIA